VKNANSHFVEEFPFILTTGLLVNHLIILLLQSLKLSLLLGIIISGCSLLWFFIRHKGEFRFIPNKVQFSLLMIVFVLLLYYFTILSEPLKAGDARFIWFLHAKMIWSAESINLNAGWHHPSVPHVDYPKLIPALAAQLSYVLGYWNEYAPKLSLFLILIPLIFWVFSFYSRSFCFLFLVLFFPFVLGRFLWNGYMDGYVAFYTAISMLLFGRYFKHRHLLDLMSGISCLALISNLKNEGILIALVGMLSIVITGILSSKFKLIEFKKIFSIYRVAWLIVIISPCILWSVFYKHKWRLTNDLQIGTTESFFRIVNRFSDGVSFPYIIEQTLTPVSLALVPFIASITLLIVSKRYIVSWIPSLITAIFYYFAMVIIYLLTPLDLTWHVFTSSERTMMTVYSCLIVGTFFVLKELEAASVEWKHKDENHT
jgi:hypothetical protein